MDRRRALFEFEVIPAEYLSDNLPASSDRTLSRNSGYDPDMAGIVSTAWTGLAEPERWDFSPLGWAALLLLAAWAAGLRLHWWTALIAFAGSLPCATLAEHFGPDDMVVVIFHDHGSRYLGKMFNDDWMREKGFFDKSGLTARDLVASGVSGELLAIEGSEPATPDSPGSFCAEWIGRARHPVVMHGQRRQIICARHKVVHERGGP